MIHEKFVPDFTPEPNCTVHTATISVTSTCATSNVEGVTIRGQNVIDVTSSAPGSYQIKVCSQPTLVDFERTGYASQQTVISDGSTVTLLCGKSRMGGQHPRIFKAFTTRHIIRVCFSFGLV